MRIFSFVLFLLLPFASLAQTMEQFAACEASVQTYCSRLGQPSQLFKTCIPNFTCTAREAHYNYNCFYTHPDYTHLGAPNFFSGTIANCWYFINENIDLEVVSIQIQQPGMTIQDGLPALLPKQNVEISVTVKATGIPASDTRSANLSIDTGGSTDVTIPFSEFLNAPNGVVTKSITKQFSYSDLGYKEVKAVIGSSAADINYSNNNKTTEAQVYCSVPQIKGSVVDWKQFSSPWGNDKYLAQKGCAITSVAMIMNKYGLNYNDKGLPLNPGTFYEGLKSFKNFYEEPISALYDGDLIWETAALYGQIAFKKQCLLNGGNDIDCTNQAKEKVMFKKQYRGSDIFPKLAEALCTGNPVTMRVPGISNSNKDHFVVALSTTVIDKKLHILTNDPGRLISKKYDLSQARSIELYKQEKDPAMLVIYLRGASEMIITDPNGRRVGKNSITGEIYSEIPDATYFLDNGIDDLDLSDGDDSSPSSIQFALNSDVVPGKYNIEVFGGASGGYKLSIMSFDDNGQISKPVEQSGSLSLGTSKAYEYVQVNEPNPPTIENAKIKTEQLIVMEKPKKEEDRLIWYGQLKPLVQTSNKLIPFNQSFNIQIQGTTINIPRNQFNSIGIGQLRYYSYSSKLYGGITIKFLATGHFYIHLKNFPDLPTEMVRVGLAVDDLSASSEVKMRCKKGLCTN